MSSLFDRLKNNRGQQATAMQARLAQQGQKTFTRDPRLWKWTWDKNGISENIIRFLPVPLVDMKAQEEGKIPADSVLTPCAMLMKHNFQGPGGWYIENSPQTFGLEDPVRDHDRPLWAQQKATKNEALKNTLKDRLPDTKYYANILVIKDGNNPDNNGKVMLLEFGPAIKKILDTAQNPPFASDPTFDPFDLWEGANLDLKLIGEQREFKNWKGYVPKFDRVGWMTPGPLFEDEKEMQAIWEQEHSLFEYFNPENFSSYEVLEQRLRKALVIPEGQPLVETGAASVAQAPTGGNEPVKTTAQNSVQQQTAEKSVQAQQTAQPNTPANPEQTPNAKESASIDDFEKFLND